VTHKVSKFQMLTPIEATVSGSNGGRSTGSLADSSPDRMRGHAKMDFWLQDCDPPVIASASLSRAVDTLELLANQSGAIPLTGWLPK